jgi:hypothetical protein
MQTDQETFDDQTGHQFQIGDSGKDVRVKETKIAIQGIPRPVSPAGFRHGVHAESLTFPSFSFPSGWKV